MSLTLCLADGNQHRRANLDRPQLANCAEFIDPSFASVESFGDAGNGQEENRLVGGFDAGFLVDHDWRTVPVDGGLTVR